MPLNVTAVSASPVNKPLTPRCGEPTNVPFATPCWSTSPPLTPPKRQNERGASPLTDVAYTEEPFDAVTATRSVASASAAATRYVLAVAPAIGTQDPPLELQRRHSYENANGCVPDQLPVEAVNV